MPMKMINLLFLLLFFTQGNIFAAEYTLKIQTDKQKLYLGEKIDLQLLFTYDDLEDYELQDLEIPHCTIKELYSSDYKNQNGSFVEETHYELTPLRAGIFEIKKFIMHIETIKKNYKNFDNRSKYTKKFSIESNSLNIDVLALPQDISVIGNYTLDASVDKEQVHTGEIVTLTLTLHGHGNITNLNALNIHIPNATSFLVMSAKSSKKHLLSRTYEIVAQKSYIVPAISFKYFDTKLGIVRIAQTNALAIKITDAKDTKNSTKIIEKRIFFLFGLLSASLLYMIYQFIKYMQYKKQPPSYLSSLKNIKNQHVLYKMIVVHLGKDKELDRLIYILEDKETTLFKATKKQLIQRVKALNINHY